MYKPILGLAGAMTLGAAMATVVGCGIVSSPRLPADAFVTNAPVIGPEAGQGTDHSGQLVVGEQHRPQRQEPKPDPERISNTVRDAVKPPTGDDFTKVEAIVPPHVPATEPAATQADATQPAVAVGNFQWIGCVVARVDSEPIYADKVLSTLDRVLRAEANANGEQRFRAIAQDLIYKQISEFVRNEEEFAAARKNLEKTDEAYARLETAEWRKVQVRKAGGSEELARQHARDDGIDFDEQIKQQYRINLIRRYYQTKVYSLIQIRVQDMRQYYQANARLFQTPSAAKFRVIWVSADVAGSTEAALKKAHDIHDRASKGESFSDLAGTLNDDEGKRASKGAVAPGEGWMEKGQFVVEAVEDALWKMQAGQVTEPIPGKNGGASGYWIAKLEDIHPGKVEPFENEKVQEKIRGTLQSEQFNKLREAHLMELMRHAIVAEVPGAVNVTIEMAMQKYKFWTEKH